MYYAIYKVDADGVVSELLGYINVNDALFDTYIEMFEHGSVLLVPQYDWYLNRKDKNV